MRINSFFALIFLSFGVLAQKNSTSNSTIDQIFLTFPDSVVKMTSYQLSYGRRDTLLNLLKNEQRDEIFYKYHISFYEYNFNGTFIKMVKPQLGPMPTCEIKLFPGLKDSIVAVTSNYYNHASTETEKIVFYKRTKESYSDATNETLNTFNFFTDNFSDSIINILSHYFSRDLHLVRFNEVLLYSFTPSDTVYISNSFFDIPVGDLLDNDKHFDGEFYTKKYIMDNGKLRLAE
jgi:hypothetical protein